MSLKKLVLNKLLVILTIPIVAGYSLLPFVGSAAADAAPVNLIANPLVETPSSTPSLPQNWQTGGWGSNTASFSYLNTGSTNDANSVNVSISSYTNGDAKWYFNPVNVTAGDEYAYSDSYEATTASEVVVAFNLSDGTTSYDQIGAPIASSNWTQFTANFVAPATTVSTTVYHLINSVGSLTTDNFSLSSTPSPTVSVTSPIASASVSGSNVLLSAAANDTNGISSVQFQIDGLNIGSPVTSAPYQYNWDSTTVGNGVHSITAVATNVNGITSTSSGVSITIANVLPIGTNIVPNPLVETASSTPTIPLDWQTGNWGTNTTSFSYLKTGSTGDTNSLSLKISAYTSGDAKWYFNPVNVSTGQEYTYSDYYQSTVASTVDVVYTLSNGTIEYLDVANPVASTSWQQFSTTFVVPAGVVNVTIYHLINSIGTLTTDNFSLATSTVPTATITTPVASTATSNLYSGNVTLSANATDNSGVASVQFEIDGLKVGSPVTSTPYSYVWNSASTTNGYHVVTAVVTNVNNVSASSPPVSFEVSNTTPTGTNLVPNPLMTTVNSTNANDPQDWQLDSWGTNSFTQSYLTTGSPGDSRSLQIQMKSYTSGDAKWTFTPQNVVQDTQYQFSDYYESNVQTLVNAVFTMADGSTEYEIIGIPYAASTWTQFSTKFSVPSGAQTVTIYHLIQSVGTLTIDNASMTPYTPVGFTRPILTLTFDDGYETEYTNGLPLLKQYGFTSTQFIITDLIGKSGYMTAAQLKTFTADGDEMASHTVTHDDMTQETAAQLKTETTTSQTTLKTDTGVSPTDMAYPYGLYNAAAVSAVKTVYSAARGVESGFNSKDNYNQYDLKVEDIYTTTTTAQVADWVAQAQKTKTWLIFVYHGVDTNTTTAVDSDIYQVTPTQLSAQLSAIKASGIAVETMAKAVTEVSPQV